MEKLHSFHNIVQLAKSTRPYPMSISDHVIVVPYFSVMQTSAACQNDGLVYWRGSTHVVNGIAKRVRKHIMRFAGERGFDVVASIRGECTGAGSLCINGFGHGRDQLAKGLMRKQMSQHEFCFVPEGDSPESSRLADAINALCIPVVISRSIAVLRSNVWGESVVVIHPDAFLRMDAADVLRRVRATNISCSVRQRLRHETSANMILHRLGELLNESVGSHVNSIVG